MAKNTVNGTLFKSKKQFYYLFPLGLLLLFLLAVFPILLSAIAADLSQWATGKTCHEANCFWAGLFWYSFYTIPLAIILSIVYVIIAFVDFLRLKS